MFDFTFDNCFNAKLHIVTCKFNFTGGCIN